MMDPITTLQTLRDHRDVAELLGVSPKFLTYHLYVLPERERYIQFFIEKKSGGVREINTPIAPVKQMQQTLGQILGSIYYPRVAAHGYLKNKSIVTNANHHVNRANLLNLDLKDFFSFLHFGRVRGVLINGPFYIPENIATIFAQLCCFNNSLPQGAPASPVLSNMICIRLDQDLVRIAKKHGCFYTRYADDITFSTNRPEFPLEVATRLGEDKHHIEVGHEIRACIEANGFVVNEKKVRLQTNKDRQEVTGLIVNERVNVPRSFVRQVRAMLHAWEKYGLVCAENEYHLKYQKKQRKSNSTTTSFKDVLRGKIEYIGMVRSHDDLIYQNFLRQFHELEAKS